MEYFSKIKLDIKTVLEVGCGTGVYPIREKEMFKGLEYIGIDFSSANIEYCKDHSEFNFLVGDFIKMNVNKKNDLVFSLKKTLYCRLLLFQLLIPQALH